MKIELMVKNGYLMPVKPESLKTLKDGLYIVDLKNNDTRTNQQNRSLWLWLDMIADNLNANNHYIQETIKAEVNWNKDSVKALIFNPVMKALYNKDSSTKLNKGDFDKIIDTIVLIFAKKGITIPDFPNEDDI